MKPSEANYQEKERVFVSSEELREWLINILSNRYDVKALISFHGTICGEIGMMLGTCFQEY